MKTLTPESNDEPDFLRGTPDFSLVLGGPLFQLLRRAHLSDDTDDGARRIIIISLFAWLPLLLLSTLEGRMLGGSAVVPFLLDKVHQVLVAPPLLIAAELVVHLRASPGAWLERLIPEGGRRDSRRPSRRRFGCATRCLPRCC